MTWKPWHTVVMIVIIFFLGAVASAYFFVQSKTPEEILKIPLVKDSLIKTAGADTKQFVDLLPYFLGFTQPRTYLILFENNTEMRPGGGFIGSYVTVRVQNGKMETLVVEGSEVLDKRTPATWKPAPPKILQEKLGVDRWYFRDSNWSPDFIQSSKKTLELYKAEGGVAADKIDAVIAITPNVLEELLKITGPVTVEGVTFTAQNVVATLENEVEYQFENKGIDFVNRKKIIDPFFHTLLKKIAPDAILHTQKYFDLFDQLAKEKYVLAYFKDEKIQKILSAKNWTGEVKSAPRDYLFWVDANLGALKTDRVLKRELNYNFVPFQKSGSPSTFLATAKMKYTHTGVFDKFTSRYRTYARVYVPEGSTLSEVNSIQNGKKTRVTVVDQGSELGKHWFGAFFTIEPQQTKELEFVYILPQSVADHIKGAGVYTLLAQKQAGVENVALTLSLNFGTNIYSASPAEVKSEWGDDRYHVSNLFTSDQDVSISLK